MNYSVKKKEFKKVRWDIPTFLFALLIVSSSNLFAFDAGGYNVKWSQIVLIVYCIFNFFIIIRLFKRIRIVDRFTNFTLFSIIAYAIFSMSYTLDIRLTLKQLVQIVLNVLIFYAVVASLHYKLSLYNNMRKVTVCIFWLFVFFTIIHYFLGFIVPEFRTYSATEGALFEGIKPSVFFLDSNWHCNYVFFLYFAIYLFYRKGDVSKKVMKEALWGMLIVSVLTLSRICLLVFIVHVFFYYYRLNKFILLSLIIGAVLVYNSPIPKMILPERYTYDLYDSDRNPRLQDSAFLIEGVSLYQRETLGMGLGTLAIINKYNRIRASEDEYSTSINVLPVQIYYDYGLMGLIFFSTIFLWGVLRTRNEDTRFILISSFIFCSFHMPGYMTFFWLFMGFFYYLLNIERSYRLIPYHKE